MSRTSLLKSFMFAMHGIRSAVKTERNLRIHFCISVIVVIAGLWFSLSSGEWLVIVLAIGGMLSFEMVNTALERVVDLATKDFHPIAKQAKDMAAGAVFIFAVTCVVLGFIIFLPKLFHQFGL